MFLWWNVVPGFSGDRMEKETWLMDADAPPRVERRRDVLRIRARTRASLLPAVVAVAATLLVNLGGLTGACGQEVAALLLRLSA